AGQCAQPNLGCRRGQRCQGRPALGASCRMVVGPEGIEPKLFSRAHYLEIRWPIVDGTYSPNAEANLVTGRSDPRMWRPPDYRRAWLMHITQWETNLSPAVAC